jgi:hypothetical protein
MVGLQVTELVGDERDLRTFLAKPPFHDGYVRVFCPNHGDRNRPSAALYEQNLYCYTCGFWLGRLPTLALIKEGKLESAGVVGGGAHNAKARYLPVSLAAGYHELLMGPHAGRIQWLLDRGITLDAIRRFQLGHTGRAFTIPVFARSAGEDSDGLRADHLHLAALKFRLDPAKDLCPDNCTCDKYWGSAGSNSGVLYDPTGAASAGGSDDAQLRVRRRIVLTEGELDAVILAQHGIPACSSISGSQDTRCLEGIPAGVEVTLCYDQDTAGLAGAEKVAAFLRERGCTTRTVTWRTELRNGKTFPKDATDFVLGHGIGNMRLRLAAAR